MGIFEDLDDDKSGTLSLDEFESNMENPRIIGYLATLGLSTWDAKSLFKMVDIDDANNVTIDDFIQGCMRLKGTARSVDLCTLLFENRKQSRDLKKLTRYCEKQLGNNEGKRGETKTVKPPSTPAATIPRPGVGDPSSGSSGGRA